MADYRRETEKDNIEERVIQIDRITRVVKGGRRLRFRAIVVVGDGQGRVGLAVDKSGEVVGAIEKATRKARKNMINVNLSETTISHEVTAEHAGARVFLKPAQKGTGVIAGGAVRPILEVVGIKDILSKIQGSSSKLNNAYATIEALKILRPPLEKNQGEKSTGPKGKDKGSIPKVAKKAKIEGDKDDSGRSKKTDKK
jgi:small subunit ribosomal protein S5